MGSVPLVPKKKYVFNYLCMIFLIVVSLAFAKTLPVNFYPNCTIFNNVTYEKELILNNIDAPYHLAIDYDMNTLFFSHNGNGTIINNKLYIFEMAYLHLDSKRIVHLKEVKGGFAAAVDNINKVVYLGGDDGVYIFDWTKNIAKNLNIVNESIWQMFYNDGLYITTYPKGLTYWYIDRYIAELLDTTKILNIAVDENRNLIFCNETGLYVYVAGVRIFKLGKYKVTGFALDVRNKLYFSTSTAIYYIGYKVVKVAEIKGINGLAIERNGNFIYSTDDSIIRIKRTKNNCTMNKDNRTTTKDQSNEF